jgi:glycosyltransferase involved in cell wall biosynthesis
MFEIIAVDNASTEDLSGAVPADARIRLIVEPRLGSYAARNRGLSVAGGDILAFTDSDCIPDPDWLTEGVSALVANRHIDMIGGAGGPSAFR